MSFFLLIYVQSSCVKCETVNTSKLDYRVPLCAIVCCISVVASSSFLSGNFSITDYLSPACQVELRRRGAQIESVRMGCKTHHACHNNKLQNFHQKPQNSNKSNWVYEWYQCAPMSLEKESTCRQCCATDKDSFDNQFKFFTHF